jgi:hypothetical protein
LYNGTNRATFNYPVGVVADNSGSLFVTDGGNNNIRKVTPIGTNWVTTTIAGARASEPGSADGTNGQARFNVPQGIALDSLGNFFVADTGNATIRKVTPIGTNWVTITIAGSPGHSGGADGTNGAALFAPGGGELAVDENDNLFFADYGNHTIRKITLIGTNWVTTTIAGVAGQPGFANGTNGAARFWYPNGVALDSAGTLYVADSRNSVIRRITPEGTNWVTTTIAGYPFHAGSEDGTNNAAGFIGPEWVTVDSSGVLYVAESTRVRKITQFGTNWVTTTIGGLANSTGSADGTNSAALFSFLGGVALDTHGNLYAVDYNNCTVKQGVSLPVIQESMQVNGQAGLAWSAIAGQTFQLQFSTDLNSGKWTNLGTPTTATNGTPSASDPASPGSGRFYRVVQMR